MMARFKDFRRKKRLRDRQRVAQVIGGAAGTWQGDPMAFERLAPERRWEAERARFMAQKEQEAKVAARIGEEERYYFGKEQEERRTILSDIGAEVDRLSRIAETDARLAQNANEARARLQGIAKLEKVRQIQSKLLQSEGLTPAAEELRDQVFSQYNIPKPPAIGPLNDAYIGREIIEKATADDPVRVRELHDAGVIVQGADGMSAPAPGVRASELAKSLGVEGQDLADAQSLGRKQARAEQQRRIEATAQDPSVDMDAALRAVDQSEVNEHDKRATAGNSPRGNTKTPRYRMKKTSSTAWVTTSAPRARLLEAG
jgi:hypothetical protein